MKRILIIVGILFFFAIGIGIYNNTLDKSNQNIINNLKVASVSIDDDAIRYISGEIDKGTNTWELSQSQQYKDIVITLKRLTESFDGVRWSYIMQPKGDKAQLTVLTIAPNKDDELTLPGYLYDIDDYPAMHSVLFGGSEYSISNIVWDKDYKILTRSAFINMKSGILAVDLDIESILKEIFDSMIIAIIYTCILLIGVFSLIKYITPATALSVDLEVRKVFEEYKEEKDE